ncbi:MAG: hypothetical protein IKW83_07360 [Muribaculaceae bacterium]|nr:hypothetical protein [Muribaculaceae bacterium]
MSNEKETMNRQERKEQEYSDIKVSKETAKVLMAMADICEFSSCIGKLEYIHDDVIEEIEKHIYAIRDELEKTLIHAIIEQQQADMELGYTFKVI